MLRGAFTRVPPVSNFSFPLIVLSEPNYQIFIFWNIGCLEFHISHINPIKIEFNLVFEIFYFNSIFHFDWKSSSWCIFLLNMYIRVLTDTNNCRSRKIPYCKFNFSSIILLTSKSLLCYKHHLSPFTISTSINDYEFHCKYLF